LPELFIGGEGLRRGARDLLGTLLHEATHGVAAARGIKATGRQGRYHNAKFRDLAAELGITVSKDPKIGWSPTTVPALTVADYGDQVAELEEALTAYCLADVPADRTSPTTASWRCEPARKIRLSKTIYELGPIDCGVCERAFTDDVEEG
jgi:hypothetical protein